uniref:Uncharacterized protein n=1 Tax=uncultured prokaryote TaxID=198431 RepID=A0A0H5Q5P3_9ZZZZ|nr:hypothetical protein [uncultured prokaryote]
MSNVYPMPAESRVIALTLTEDINGWVVKLHVEPRTGRKAKRAPLQLIDRWYLGPQGRIGTREHLDEVLAEAILQRRLPGID